MLSIFVALIWGIEGVTILGQEELYSVVTHSNNINRRLLQTDEELSLLCSVSSDMKGAFVMFNEELLKQVCGNGGGGEDVGCGDIEPINGNTCQQVVNQNLCDDPFYIRKNYCAQSCNRCNKGACKTTKQGCTCLDDWTYSSDPQQYSGCANPDNDPQGSWCKIDTKTCIGVPSGKNVDHCDPLCQTDITSDDRSRVEMLQAGCEQYGAECSNQCEGEENIEEIKCYGLEEENRECICINPTLPTRTAASNTIKTPGGANIQGSCYDFMPKKEGSCAERIAWGSCDESWMSEKFYCAISCNFCDDPLTKQYNCLPDFQDCLNTCDGEDNIQEFACFRQMKKSECACSKEVKRSRSAVLDIVGEDDDCRDFLPANEGTCKDRLGWGSCKEQWMKEKNYCAKTCGFCTPSSNGGSIFLGGSSLSVDDTDYQSSLSANVGGEIPVPISPQTNNQVPKNPTNTIRDAKILEVLTFQDERAIDLEKEFLDAHNAIRKAHCTRQLVWSTELASEAQSWTQKCSTNTNQQISSTYGQNIYTSNSNSMSIAAEAIQYWYELSSSITDYNNLPTNDNSYNSLYQLLWQQSSSIGCGITQCTTTGNTVVLCLYNPKAIYGWNNIYTNVYAPC